MKRLSAFVAALALCLCAFTACNILDKANGFDPSLKCKKYENCAVFTFDGFADGESASFELSRTGLGEGAIYYQISLEEGAVSIGYKDTGFIYQEQPLGEFAADDETPVNGSGGYVEGDRITIVFESHGTVSGEVIIAFAEDLLKSVHGNLQLHKHTYSYISAGDEGHYERYTCGCSDTHEGTVPHYDEDSNGECDACEYAMETPDIT